MSTAESAEETEDLSLAEYGAPHDLESSSCSSGRKGAGLRTGEKRRPGRKQPSSLLGAGSWGAVHSMPRSSTAFVRRRRSSASTEALALDSRVDGAGSGTDPDHSSLPDAMREQLSSSMAPPSISSSTAGGLRERGSLGSRQRELFQRSFRWPLQTALLTARSSRRHLGDGPGGKHCLSSPQGRERQRFTFTAAAVGKRVVRVLLAQAGNAQRVAAPITERGSTRAAGHGGH
ncbi:hypothetical protein PO909_013022 [Leuciscus waleckii]